MTSQQIGLAKPTAAGNRTYLEDRLNNHSDTGGPEPVAMSIIDLRSLDTRVRERT
jgi:hypothetical protein